MFPPICTSSTEHHQSLWTNLLENNLSGIHPALGYLGEDGSAAYPANEAMKQLLARLAGIYAALGATAYFLYRRGYRRTQVLRDWTDNRSRRLTESLDGLRDELLRLRSEARQLNVRELETEPVGSAREKENRHLVREMPDQEKRAA